MLCNTDHLRPIVKVCVRCGYQRRPSDTRGENCYDCVASARYYANWSNAQLKQEFDNCMINGFTQKEAMDIAKEIGIRRAIDQANE